MYIDCNPLIHEIHVSVSFLFLFFCSFHPLTNFFSLFSYSTANEARQRTQAQMTRRLGPI